MASVVIAASIVVNLVIIGWIIWDAHTKAQAKARPIKDAIEVARLEAIWRDS